SSEARDGSNHRVPGRGAEAARQSRQECLGTAVGAQVPRVQLHVAPPSAAENRSGEPEAAAREGTSVPARGARTLAVSDDQRAEPGAARLDELLPVHARTGRVGGVGRVGSSEAALPAVAAVEAGPHPSQSTAEARAE